MGDSAETGLADGNIAESKTRGPYQRYSVDYAADGRHVIFAPGSHDSFKATCEFAVLVYDDQGVLINSLNRTAVATVNEAEKAVILKSGIHMHQEISVPIKGHYWLRVGVHDRTGGRMGAVEVNLDNVNRLASLKATTLAAPNKK
jgi:hypothetical protein